MVYCTSCTVHVDEQVHSHKSCLYFLSTGIIPFSETNFQYFSKIQIDFSRTLIYINHFTPKITKSINLVLQYTNTRSEAFF